MMIDFGYLWPKWDIRPEGVLHLGASTGQEREFYRSVGVNTVIWVEAIPEVFEQLVENTKDIPGSICVNACVGDEDGKEIVFNVSNNEAQSSSYLELGYHTKIHPEVHYVRTFATKMHRVDTILKNMKLRGKWFLNMDLQGAELPALIGMGDRINDFEFIYSEVNKRDTYVGCATVEMIDAYLAKFGFRRVETGTWVGDTWTDALYVKHEALSNSLIDEVGKWQ